ncbi:MAG: Fic family protein [Alphaproteobacteria bacterium]
MTVLEQLATIKSTLANFSEGAFIEEIESASNLGLNRRTLQRRLKMLEEHGALSVTGKGRGTRYQLLDSGEGKNSSAPVVVASPESEKIRRYVNQPTTKRKPVSYERNFLEAYQPNTMFYLSKSERNKLLEIGRTPDIGQQAGTYAKDILNRLLIDLSWNSSRLEGNTYSLLDTKRLIEHGEQVDDKPTADAQMILNHKEAIEFLVSSAEEIGFNRYTVLNLHALLAENLLPDQQAVGRLRRGPIGISHSVYTPTAIPQVIDDCFNLILEKAQAIQDPFEQSFFAMVHLPYLQPFDDVNKRVSRLAVNIPLLQHNLTPLSFVDVTESDYIQAVLGVYELNKTALLRDVFMWAYERSADRYSSIRQSIGEPDYFRIKHRNAMYALVADVVTNGRNQQEAAKLVATEAQVLPIAERAKFIEVVETELLALHEGNFARYRIRPSEFMAWQKDWQKKK